MPSSQPTDDELMKAYCDGHMTAFEMLYQRYERPLHRYICRVLGSGLTAQADEVLQDTWIKLIDARGRWTPRADASFKTWLYTLAYHRAIDIMRKRGREWSLDTDAPTNTFDDAPGDGQAAWQHWPAATATQPEQQAFWRSAGQQLLHCLDALPDAQRAAFVLHHEDGMNLDDMARALGVEFETIKSRLRYAVKKLRLCMGAHLAPLIDIGSGIPS